MSKPKEYILMEFMTQIKYRESYLLQTMLYRNCYLFLFKRFKTTLNQYFIAPISMDDRNMKYFMPSSRIYFIYMQQYLHVYSNTTIFKLRRVLNLDVRHSFYDEKQFNFEIIILKNDFQEENC